MDQNQQVRLTFMEQYLLTLKLEKIKIIKMKIGNGIEMIVFQCLYEKPNGKKLKNLNT